MIGLQQQIFVVAVDPARSPHVLISALEHYHGVYQSNARTTRLIGRPARGLARRDGFEARAARSLYPPTIRIAGRLEFRQAGDPNSPAGNYMEAKK